MLTRSWMAASRSAWEGCSEPHALRHKAPHGTPSSQPMLCIPQYAHSSVSHACSARECWSWCMNTHARTECTRMRGTRCQWQAHMHSPGVRVAGSSRAGRDAGWSDLDGKGGWRRCTRRRTHTHTHTTRAESLALHHHDKRERKSVHGQHASQACVVCSSLVCCAAKGTTPTLLPLPALAKA